VVAQKVLQNFRVEMSYAVEKPIVNSKSPSGRGGNSAVYVSLFI
jgi:hypothetical protein